MIRNLLVLLLSSCAIGSPAYRACAPGNAPACMQAGAELGNNPDSAELAFKQFATACDDGVAEGCQRAVEMLPNRFSSDSLEGRYADIRTKACELGINEQCLAGRWPKDAKLLELGCRRAPESCGKVVRKMDEAMWGDRKEERQAAIAPLAAELAMMGCDAAPETCLAIGQYKWLGDDVRIKLYGRACVAKVGTACTAQAALLPEGDEARSLYRRGCELRDTEACAALGKLAR